MVAPPAGGGRPGWVRRLAPCVARPGGAPGASRRSEVPTGRATPVHDGAPNMTIPTDSHMRRALSSDRAIVYHRPATFVDDQERSDLQRARLAAALHAHVTRGRRIQSVVPVKDPGSLDRDPNRPVLSRVIAVVAASHRSATIRRESAASHRLMDWHRALDALALLKALGIDDCLARHDDPATHRLVDEIQAALAAFRSTAVPSSTLRHGYRPGRANDPA